MENIFLSIVVPVYNEANKVQISFSKLVEFFKSKDYKVEYIFINDGSTDDTLAALKRIEKDSKTVRVLCNSVNMGKGFALKNGIMNAMGQYVLFSDVDLSTPLETLNRFEKYLNDYDIIMGCRWCREAKIELNQPLIRRFMSFFFYAIVHIFFLKGIRDTNCGFKCYRTVVAKDIFSKIYSKGWGFDVEILYIAQKKNYKIIEVPVTWRHHKDSRVNLFRVPYRTICELVKIKINDFKGRYE